MSKELSLNILVNDSLCIGCGVCAAMCEDVFIIDEESGLAKVVSQKISKELLEEIIETCPVNAIYLAD